MSSVAIEVFADVEWMCRCEEPGAMPDPETRILERWTCPWCGSVWEVVEHFPNDVPHWWQRS